MPTFAPTGGSFTLTNDNSLDGYNTQRGLGHSTTVNGATGTVTIPTGFTLEVNNTQPVIGTGIIGATFNVTNTGTFSQTGGDIIVMNSATFLSTRHAAGINSKTFNHHHRHITHRWSFHPDQSLPL